MKKCKSLFAADKARIKLIGWMQSLLSPLNPWITGHFFFAKLPLETSHYAEVQFAELLSLIVNDPLARKKTKKNSTLSRKLNSYWSKLMKQRNVYFHLYVNFHKNSHRYLNKMKFSMKIFFTFFISRLEIWRKIIVRFKFQVENCKKFHHFEIGDRRMRSIQSS